MSADTKYAVNRFTLFQIHNNFFSFLNHYTLLMIAIISHKLCIILAAKDFLYTGPLPAPGLGISSNRFSRLAVGENDTYSLELWLAIEFASLLSVAYFSPPEADRKCTNEQKY